MNISLFWSSITGEVESLKSCSTIDAVERIHQMIKVVDHRLGVEVGDDSGIRTVIISANGYRELVPTVEELLSCSPTASGLRFQAFKAARGFDFVFRHQALSINPIEWTFAPLRDSSGALAIMINTYSKLIEQSIVEVVVETGIGEHAFLKIANLFVASDDDLHENERWLPITSLARFVDWDSTKSTGAPQDRR